MKKCIFAIVTLMTMSLSVNAQEKCDGKMDCPKERPELTAEQMIEMQTKQTAHMLRLTEEQTAQLLEINKAYDANVKALLTEEQAARYDKMKMMERRQGGMRDGRGEKGKGPRPCGEGEMPAPAPAPAPCE